MTVKELIEELEYLDPDDQVLISRDAEGNGFSLVRQVADNLFYHNDTLYDRYWNHEEADMSASEWEIVRKHALPAVVLWP